MRTLAVVAVSCLFTSFQSSAQRKDSTRICLDQTFRKTELVLGTNWQANWRDKDNTQTRNYIEVGIGRSIHTYHRHGVSSAGIYLSEEMYFGKKNIYGTKLGVYAHYLLDLGFSMIYYTDFKKGNFKLRPELGIGAGPFRAVFGFNLPTIDNKAFEELRNHRAQVTVQLMIPVKKTIVRSNKQKK